jgi:hypothetical protein
MMPETFSNKEAIDMMLRCKNEIISLRATIDRLKPKADAYDNLAAVLRLLPQPGIGMGEDLVWILDRRMRELTPPPAKTDSSLTAESP